MDNPERLKRLKKRLNEFEASFESQEACVAWAAQTAPLLNFNNNYYGSFTHSAQYMNVPSLSSYTIVPHANNMKSILLQAITELEHGLTSQRKEKTMEAKYPEKVTLSWLYSHVPMSFWFWAVGILLAVFVGGVNLGSSKFYKEKLQPAVSVFNNPERGPANQ